MPAATSRKSVLLLVLAALGLNWLLFVPAFALRGSSSFDWHPFTPEAHPFGSYGFDLRSLVEYVKALLLRRANEDVFRLSFEYLLFIAALIATAGRKGAAMVRAALAAAYTAFLVLLTYHHAYAHFYRVEPALWEDVTLLSSLLRYVESELGLGALRAILAGTTAAVLIVFALAWFVFGAVQRAQSSVRQRAGLAVLCVWAACSLGWFGIERNDPVIQLPSKVLAKNLEASLARRAEVMTLRSSPVDRRYEQFSKATLAAHPRVYLLMIEAYGQRVASDPQLDGIFQELTARTMARLSAKGFHARTAYSRAPIYGGRSWLSIGTVQTGVRIEQPSIYDEMAKVSSSLPTLTSFFKGHGYRTLALQSGNYVKDDPRLFDVFGRDRVIEGPDLPYTGIRTGYGGIPDQYALSWFRENVLSKERDAFFAFYMSVSTHFSWPEIPFAADWKQLDRPEAPPLAPYQPIPALDALPDGFPSKYMRSIVYEWRALADFIEAESSDDAIFFIVGDHQPLLERTMDDVAELARLQSLNTPVHVISRDAAFVERFAARGFVEGLYAKAGPAELMHEGLFSLFVREFVARHGEVGQTFFTPYFPQGSSLSAFGPELLDGGVAAGARDGGEVGQK